MRVSRFWGAAVAALLLFPAAVTGQPQEEGRADEGRTALVIIDIQNFYFEGGNVPLAGPVEASLKAKILLERFREKGWPVVHVQHLPKDVADPDPEIADAQYRIHPNVLPLAGEMLIGKHHANSFRETTLLALLREQNVRRLVVAGMQTHMCVEAATRAAADLGFDVTVIHDATATRPLSFGDVEIPAPQVHAAALAAMLGSYAEVASAEEWLSKVR
jgi:nicotinamidase-related amidase